VENNGFPVTHVFPADELVKLSIRTADPLQSVNWKDTILSDAAYEGVVFCGIVENRIDDAIDILIPKYDVRKWERVATANDSDVTIIDAPTQCAVALSKLKPH